MRYRIDSTWTRYGSVVLAGSPLRLFRTTAAGEQVLRQLERGDDVGGSRLAERLVDSGSIHPIPSAPGRFGLDDVTIVTPQLRTSPTDRAHDDGRITIDDGSVPALPGASRRLAHNQGPATARNTARALVDTPLVAFVDADVGTGDRAIWLRPLLPHFDDPSVGLVAPRVAGEDGSPLDLGGEPARIRAGTRVSYVPGAALVVRVDALDSIGGFDPTLRFGEDVDLVWRLDEAGWRCRYEPTSTVWHEPRPNIRARLRQHAGYGSSAASLALRHPSALSPVRCNGWTAGVWAALAIGHPAAAVLLAIGSSAALAPKLADVPPSAAIGLALRGHLAAGRQFAQAVRRTWWPIILVASLVSRRARRIAVASLLVGGRAAPTDVAYGWGVWIGIWRLRTWAPIVPRLSAWPGRRPDPPTVRPR